jgi:hypothetical protein
MSISPNFIGNVFTYVLTNGIITIKSTDGINVVALQLLSGSATFKGNKTVGSLASTAISLLIDDPVTIALGTDLDSFVIDASAGVVNVIAAQQ